MITEVDAMTKKELLRGLPKIDEVLKQESLVVLSEEKGDLMVTEAVRAVIAGLRASILDLSDKKAEEFDASALEIEAVAEAAEAKVLRDEELNLYPLINATGTILHTNLGRAPLCRDAVENVARVSRGYSDLEYNVPKGKRGSRHDLVSELIAELTGAEDAMVVNNNAAATMIVLATIGTGKEIVVSRGELVEIGGAFRIPDIMMQSGAYLQEVGTSNKTKASDYENAIITKQQAEEAMFDMDPRGGMRFETGALMKVHKSNYDIVGFTEEASLEELVEIGKKKYIKAMKKHPLARAMRVDKMTFAALEATLMKYRDPKVALRDIPVLNMISASGEEMRAKAERLADAIKRVNPALSLELVPVEDQIGGGSAPMVRLPGWAVSVKDGMKSADRTERKLRKAEVPVVARINEDRLLLCVRTIAEDELQTVAEALRK